MRPPRADDPSQAPRRGLNPATAQPPADRFKSTYISQHVAAFRATRDPRHLASAIHLTVKQKRVGELAFGLWCALRHRPGGLRPRPPALLGEIEAACLPSLLGEDCWSRDELVRAFAPRFAVAALPEDFAAARREAVAVANGRLILGEYGEQRKRIAVVDGASCWLHPHYADDARVRHVHAVHPSLTADEFLVTTGDAAKYLDSWRLQPGRPAVVKRLRHSLAGYTAIARAADRLYFGSDFSGRMNYLERMDGRRFFFPELASKMYPVAFECYRQRYIVSIHKELAVSGHGSALCVFDAVAEEFIGCSPVGEARTRALPAPTVRLPIPLRALP